MHLQLSFVQWDSLVHKCLSQLTRREEQLVCTWRKNYLVIHLEKLRKARQYMKSI